MSENQVFYHRGEREGRKSFKIVFNLLRGFAHSVVESMGMAISLEAPMTPGVISEHENAHLLPEQPTVPSKRSCGKESIPG